MPSGTGKTAALLSFIIAYQQTRGRCKLIYCSRTVPEINKALDELERLMAYRASALGTEPSHIGLAADLVECRREGGILGIGAERPQEHVHSSTSQQV